MTITHLQFGRAHPSTLNPLVERCPCDSQRISGLSRGEVLWSHASHIAKTLDGCQELFYDSFDMGMGAKALRYLEEKKRRLELQMVATAKLIDEMPPSIKAEMRRASTKLGIRDILEGKADRSQVAQLTVTDYQLLVAFFETIRVRAEAEYELAEIESVLRPGRAKGSRNKQPKAADPAIAPALLEWETYILSNPESSERTVARRLAFRHCPMKTKEARDKFADRLRSARRNSRKRLYRKWAEAMA